MSRSSAVLFKNPAALFEAVSPSVLPRDVLESHTAPFLFGDQCMHTNKFAENVIQRLEVYYASFILRTKERKLSDSDKSRITQFISIVLKEQSSLFKQRLGSSLIRGVFELVFASVCDEMLINPNICEGNVLRSLKRAFKQLTLPSLVHTKKQFEVTIFLGINALRFTALLIFFVIIIKNFTPLLVWNGQDLTESLIFKSAFFVFAWFNTMRSTYPHMDQKMRINPFSPFNLIQFIMSASCWASRNALDVVILPGCITDRMDMSHDSKSLGDLLAQQCRESVDLHYRDLFLRFKGYTLLPGLRNKASTSSFLRSSNGGYVYESDQALWSTLFFELYSAATELLARLPTEMPESDQHARHEPPGLRPFI